ncbi:hypothetical protein PSENEW3n2_00000837 [Picochlorum sp. SENEW3]|nr:hypothetical protein PSENEW3n2_00000837 [Picochlorum sp. SENEW3]WPT15759.1 hypothetical protein PSENEW3_00000837 [Picochlorum sp. SENEW3]
MEIPYEVDPETGEYKVPSDEVLAMLHNIIVQKNQHSCSSQCRLHGECRYGFPFPAQYSHTPVLCPKSKRYLPYCPGYRHRNTVCYVPMIALLWNAHTNVVRVTNDNLSYYLLKYTAKAEPAGSLMVEPDAMHSLTVPDCSEITRRILTDVVYSKPVSVSEAALNMLGIDVISFSDQVVFVNSCIPSQRTSAESVITRRGKDAFTLDQISAYCDRPPHMESLTIVQFYEQYDVVPRKQSTRQEGTFVVMHNKQIVKRSKQAIVRLSRYAPGSEDPEGFFFNVLLQTQTFRRENELLGRDSTYYGKCIELGLSDTTIRLRHMLETHYMNMLASEFNLDKDCQFIYDHYENQTGVETHTPVYPCPTNHHSDDVPVLTHDQQQAFDHIKRNPSGFHVIQGGPGCGKSFIINHIHQYFHSMNKNVVLCASTAIAAVNIHGQTIDRVVALERSGEKRTNINFRNKAYLYCKHADVIIVDEAFMLTASKLDICNKRILNCGDMVEEDQIAQKLFIFVGDSNQLPPICQHKSRNDNQLMQTCRVCNIMNSEFGKYTWHIHNLSTSCRFTSDPKWGEFILGLVSNNTPPSREQIKQLFSSKVLPQDQWLPFLIDNPDAISIHAKNDNALELGERLLVHKCQTAGIPVFDITPTFRILSGTPPHSDDLIAKVKESFSHDLPKIHCMRKIAIGTKVIFSKNQDFDKGLINGAVGSIVSVAYKNPNKPNRLKQTDYVTTPLHSEDMIPWALKVYVKATKRTVTLYAQEDVRYLSNGFKYATRQFPIMPASSFTAHKAQGKTIKTKVLLDIRDIFQEGQLFVMLSRVTTLHQIYLTKLPTPDLFKVSPISQCDINQ